jgi:hypothetical protein
LQKFASLLHHISSSLCPRGKTREPLNLYEILTLGTFTKSCRRTAILFNILQLQQALYL